MNSPKLQRIAVMISGRGSNMVALLDAWRDERIPGADFVFVLSDHADVLGVELARERGLEVEVIERSGLKKATHNAKILTALREREIDLVCLAGYMRLLSPVFVEAYRDRILNIHPSLLPAFPGLHAPRQAIEYGVRWSGCTVHFVDEKIDHGSIIEQRIVPVLDDDTEETLAARILVEEHIAYPQAVARVVRGDYKMLGRRVICQEG